MLNIAPYVIPLIITTTPSPIPEVPQPPNNIQPQITNTQPGRVNPRFSNDLSLISQAAYAQTPQVNATPQVTSGLTRTTPQTNVTPQVVQPLTPQTNVTSSEAASAAMGVAGALTAGAAGAGAALTGSFVRGKGLGGMAVNTIGQGVLMGTLGGVAAYAITASTGEPVVASTIPYAGVATLAELCIQRGMNKRELNSIE